MNHPLFEVVKAGLHTSIQDLGRYGFQQYGVIVGGALDTYALRLGNYLVENPEEEAGIEMAYGNSTFRFLSAAYIAIVGAKTTVLLNGRTVSMWTGFRVEKGDYLEIGVPEEGYVNYLTIRGGIDGEIFLGSKSTYLRGHFGGFGRLLKNRDVVLGDMDRLAPLPRRRLADELTPIYKKHVVARVIVSPQEQYFTKESVQTFFSTTYSISRQSDRMGYRLDGEPLTYQIEQNLITDAIPLGAIQVPNNGLPIVLLSDHQTTGGYPKIGVIASVDIPFFAQLRPGQTLSFTPITVQDGQRLWLEQERKLSITKLTG
ncbi:biotin-dependent carboxyltransferase family protein [Tepidibacillus marianensis]|uniref:5-oxoprolinase subunit C family protein n=1 Tax=Tepidibacillus marianensis TaxID=3131995 RepID=UPI0030CE4DA6